MNIVQKLKALTLIDSIAFDARITRQNKIKLVLKFIENNFDNATIRDFILNKMNVKDILAFWTGKERELISELIDEVLKLVKDKIK